MPKVIHFEIPAKNPQKSMKFYQGIFGWTFSKWEGPIDYWFTQSKTPNEPGIEGAIAKKTQPDDQIINTVGVDNLDEVIQKIKALGGKITSQKHAIPGIGWLAYFEDLDGNTLGIMQDDKDPK